MLRSLQLQIAVLLALLVAVATASVGFSGYQSTDNRLVDEVDRSLVQASAAVLLGSSPGDDPAAPAMSVNLVRLPQGTILDTFLFAVLDVDGDVVQTNTRRRIPIDDGDRALAANPEGERFRGAQIGNEPYRVRTVALVDGALVVARPLAETDAVLRDLRFRTLWQVALITVAAALVGLLIARSITRPLVVLTRAAEKVSATGKLDVAVEEPGRDEVGRLTAAFRTMLAALAGSQAEQQRLVQNAGHELRTPLTSLRMNLDVLRRHPNLAEDERDRLVDDLRRDTDELVSLVNEVIDVASGERDEVEPQPVSLADAVVRVAERLERRTGREVIVDADDTVVSASPQALERALSNLMDNAHKFDRSGEPIEVRVRRGKVEISDHGPGIPEADLDHVFERFHRSAEARTLPGSGLGLSIVRDVVLRGGGTVFASNRPGGGAVLGFELPPATPSEL